MKKLSESEIKANNLPSCSDVVDEICKKCSCGNRLVKNRRTKYGKQRFLCPTCNICRVELPKVIGYRDQFNQQIILFTKEGLGIRSTARILGISPSTVIRKILEIADRIPQPKIPIGIQKVQVDELHTFIQNKNREICVIYSWCQEFKQVLSLTVGTRSKANLRTVINPILESGIESINTDGYSGYKGVVPKKKHTTFKRRNNGIERQNLNLRTHLKRLNRKTICYSKSVAMLLAVVKIYFWS